MPASGELVDKPAETVGQRVRRLRLEQGKSLRDIEGPGADHAHISRVERGKRSATHAFIQVVARNLGVSPDYLRDGEVGSEPERRRARVDDLELKLRLEPELDHAELEASLRDLQAEATAAGDFPVAQRCRLLLGFSASHRGEHVVAVRELSRHLRPAVGSPVADMDAYLTLARSLSALGRADEAATLLEACLERIRDDFPDDQVAFVRFSVHASYALVDAGEVRQAKNILGEAVARSEQLQDAPTRARLHHSRARLAWAECDWECGRRHADRAIALIEVSEDSRNLIRAHILRSDIGLLEGDDGDETAASLAAAEHLMGPDADVQDRGYLCCQRALFAVRQGNAGEALELAREAIRLLENDPALQGRGYWALAETLVAAGRHDEALAAFEEAYELMSIEKRFLRQVVLPWARTLSLLGRVAEANQILMTAVEEGILETVG